MASSFEVEDCECLHETEKALLVLCGDQDQDRCWIPRSQLAPGNEIKKEGDTGTLRITQWFAEQKGWT